MRQLLSDLYEAWLNLSLKAKAAIVMGIVGLVLGVPTSERAMIWLGFRQSMQLQHCADDVTKPILSAATSLDAEAVGRAFNTDQMRDIQKCASEAIQKPKGSVSFLLDEYRRQTTP